MIVQDWLHDLCVCFAAFHLFWCSYSVSARAINKKTRSNNSMSLWLQIIPQLNWPSMTSYSLLIAKSLLHPEFFSWTWAFHHDPLKLYKTAIHHFGFEHPLSLSHQLPILIERPWFHRLILFFHDKIDNALSIKIYRPLITGKLFGWQVGFLTNPWQLLSWQHIDNPASSDFTLQ